MGRYFVEERGRDRTLYYQPYEEEKIKEAYFNTPFFVEQMGVVPAKRCVYENEVAVAYQIGGMQTIEEQFTEGIDEETLIAVLTTMAETAGVLKNSGVPMEQVLFRGDCIYSHDASKEVLYIVHTGSYELSTPSFFFCVTQLLKKIQINSLQYGIDKFIESYLEEQKEPSYEDFAQYLRNIRRQLFSTKEYSGQQSLSCRLGDSNIMIDELFSIEAPKFSTVRMMEQETVKKHAYLVRKRTGEKVEITKANFMIGKDDECDYQIRDNNTISRKHASIICREDGYYIKDLDSTNHTFLNHRLVKVPTELRLENQANLMFSNEIFEYLELDE